MTGTWGAILRYLAVLGLAVVCLAMAAQAARAQDTGAPTETPVPVMVDGREVFVVHGTASFPAAERAAEIARRIVQVAEASDSMTMSIRLVENEFGHQLVIDGVAVAVATALDAEREGLNDTMLTADLWGQFVEDAIRVYRTDRSAAARARGLLSGFLWTVLFIGFTVLLIWANRRVKAKGERIVRGFFRQVEEATQEIVQTRAMTEVISVAVQGLFVILFFVALYYYVSVVLFSFAETRAIAAILLNYVTDPVIAALQSVLDFMPSLTVLLIIFFLTRYLIRIARVTFENIEAGTLAIEGFQKHWVWPSFNIVRGFLVISAFIIAFPHIPGSDSAAFQGMSILLGVMVSIGSNSVVSNVLAGLFVIYRRSTNVGDRIEIGGHIGEVVAIKLTETHLKSFKNELISIPNAQLLNSEVVNYSQHIDGRGLLVHTTVGIGYDEPHQKIEELLIAAANATNGIKKSPPPFVLRKELGDFAVTYEINGFSTRGNQIPRILSDLRGHVLDIFHAEGIQIMSPNYEGDPETPKIPPMPDRAEAEADGSAGKGQAAE